MVHFYVNYNTILLINILYIWCGISVLPPKDSKLISTILLGTANCFNWIYAYKYIEYNIYTNNNNLIKETIIFIKNKLNPKHIDIGITLHGIYDLFNYYTTNNYDHISSIDKDIFCS